jgi:hypothetical protein
MRIVRAERGKRSEWRSGGSYKGKQRGKQDENVEEAGSGSRRKTKARHEEDGTEANEEINV